MAQLTINSPGVEIRERDISFTAPTPRGTNVYITGYAQQGPIDEVVLITSKQDLVQIFGPPTNAPEKYFHYSIAELLNSPATVYAGRLPYGDGSGDGFGSKYSALAYPVSSFTNVNGKLHSTLNTTTSALLMVGPPVHVELTESQYICVADGSAITWTNCATREACDMATYNTLGNAGIIVLNKSQVANNQQQEGFYVGLVSNQAGAGADTTGYRAITSVNGLYDAATSTTSFTQVPDNNLNFPLSATATDGSGESLSRVIANTTDYAIDGRSFDDHLTVGIFKLRQSLYANEATKLDYALRESYTGSINFHRKEFNKEGGANKSAFIGTKAKDAQDVIICVNDNISQRLAGGTGLNDQGTPQTIIRTLGDRWVPQVRGAGAQWGLSAVPSCIAESCIKNVFSNDSIHNLASLNPLGQFTNEKVKTKILGDVPGKIERALDNIKNDEVYDIDIIVEGGLGTIYSVACAQSTNPYFYDDEDYSGDVLTAVQGLRTGNDVTTPSSVTLRNNYSTIFNKFEQFVKPPFDGGTRGDCIFIADPIRQILIKGANTKILADKTNNFSTHVYWPMRHQFENENTSYAAVYGNWFSINDGYTGSQCWIPSSPFAAAAMARTDAVAFPWFAPAGFSRGLISFANDIAINPNQKQRDELYKNNINPIAQFPGSGMVIFGQKTLQKKASAFDRINVRRLFLTLERPVKQLSRQFVFEQNSEFTRTRLVNAITPLFERAKNNEGLYDYLIVCDERNNTPQIIDRNELVVDIYLKPTRTAEFILVNFYATRTDANFQELIGG